MSANNKITAFKKHLSLICLICTVIVPIINNFGLSLALSFIAGDILLVTPTEILKIFISALDTVNLFLVFGVLINSLIRFGFKESKNILGLCLLRIVLVYASYLAIGAIVTTNFAASLMGNVYYCITNIVIDLLLLGGAVVLTLFLRAKYLDEKNTNITVKGFFNLRNPLISVSLWVVVLISAFLLSGCVISTLSDIATYGANELNATEIIYLVTPYVKWLLKFIVGYTVMWSCAKWLDSRWKYINTSDKK